MLQEVIAESYETTVYEILGLQLQMKADQYFPMALFFFSVEGFLGGESVDEIRSYRVLECNHFNESC